MIFIQFVKKSVNSVERVRIFSLNECTAAVQVLQSEPELFPYTTRLATGLDPLNDPHSASLAELTAMYFVGHNSHASGIEGTNFVDSALDASSLSFLSYSQTDSTATMDQKLVSMMSRALGRTHEIAGIQHSVLSRPEFAAPLHNATAEYNMVLCPHNCLT